MEKGARKEKPCKELGRWRSTCNDEMLCFSQKKHQAKRELQRRRMKGEEWTEELGQKSIKRWKSEEGHGMEPKERDGKERWRKWGRKTNKMHPLK